MGCWSTVENRVFLRDAVLYFGHVVSRDGIQPDPAKTDKMRSYPTPTDVSQVCQYLGLTSSYRRFVPGFASIASPLHALLKKDAMFRWSADCEAEISVVEASIGVTCCTSIPSVFLAQSIYI